MSMFGFARKEPELYRYRIENHHAEDDWGATVTARAPDQAAEEAGRRYDQNGDYLLMRGNEITVHVRSQDGKEYVFTVRGETVPEYYASEVKRG